MTEKAPKGCRFLIDVVGEEKIFTADDFTEDQRLFAQTAKEFMDKEVFPIIEELEDQHFDKMVGLLKKAGEIGLLMIDIPEAYGGLQVDKTTSMIVTEYVSKYSAWATTYGAHTGIGMLPLLFFGNHDQKAKWLPKFATAEVIAAYALTEPGSGSDALAAKTTAELTEDGEHYLLNGSKMWITNAGFADLYTVFAQVEGDKFTAFLVEADREGVSTGAEEKKMGLKGSSTRQLNLEGVMVPKENLLGEVGKGHKIAFNILNIGRFKLGVGALGGGKRTLKVATAYAQERHQFKQPIADFGAIGQKLARMAAKLYSLESMCYRVAGYMDQSLEILDSSDADYSTVAMKAIEEFAVEDSIIKVVGSEVMDYVADEAVQIHGGYGYSAEYEVERIYRDSRINRIFEGTNEINRMLIPGMILKRTMKGELNLFAAIQKTEAALGAPKQMPPTVLHDAELSYERFLTEETKKLVVYCANQAIQKHMADLKDQQELLLDLADMISQVYLMDSTVARTLQVVQSTGYEGSALQRAATIACVAEALEVTTKAAVRVLANLSTDENREAHFAALEKFSHRPTFNVIGAHRTLAEAVKERGGYPF